MLEVGCAEGLLGQFATENDLFKAMYGIEIHSRSAEKAKYWYVKVYNADIESFDLSKIPVVDAIICADVLEHLFDPWTIFSQLIKKLDQNGYMILSIPNARHVRVWAGLVLRGRFDYHESGVLDKGHLRFFTLSNLKDLFEQNDVYIEDMVWNMAPKGKLFDRISLGLFKEFCTFHYIFRLRKKIRLQSTAAVI